MKKIYILFFLFVFCCGFSFSQNPLVKQWDKRFGGNSNDGFPLSVPSLSGKFLQQTTDGGYILGGCSFSDVSGDKTQPNRDTTLKTADYWVVKTDSLGNKQWDKRFGGTNDDRLYALQQTSDGGYILGGYSLSGISGDKTQSLWGGTDYWIVKIDSLGTKQWDKDFGGTGNNYLYSLQQTTDGGYILGGQSNSGIGGDKTQVNWGSNDYWIVKIDSLGNKQWDKDFGGTNDDRFFSLQQTTGGGYVLGGYSLSGISGDKTQMLKGLQDQDYWILKIDSLGNKKWDKDFGGLNSDELFSMQQTTDGGYILGGWSNSGIGGDKTQPSKGSNDYWIVKIDSLGNKQWDKDFGGTSVEDEFVNISQTTDGGYLMVGTSYSSAGGDKTENNLGPEQTWIIKTDSIGNKQWDKTLHTNIGHDEVGNAIQTKDGCYAFANCTMAGIGGDKTQPSQGGEDLWIIKYCEQTGEGINEIKDGQIEVYPNPASQSVTVSWPAAVGGDVNIEVVNVLGENASTPAPLQRRGERTIIDVSHLPNGVYFLRIELGDRTVNKKFVVVR